MIWVLVVDLLNSSGDISGMFSLQNCVTYFTSMYISVALSTDLQVICRNIYNKPILLSFLQLTLSILNKANNMEDIFLRNHHWEYLKHRTVSAN